MSAPGSVPWRAYDDLAVWWPLLSPVADYEAEACTYADLLTRAARPGASVLELGSGGGNNAFHMKAHVALTLVDLSDAMLALSRQINPECAHHRGDMRTVRLGETFDAVFVHDAVDYMTSEDDLLAAMRTAFVHCRPGGLALFVPDHVTETFEPSTDCGGSDAPDGRGMRYLEWSYDPHPADGRICTEYVFVMREADGRVSTAHETHVGGLFPRDTWMQLLADAGFRPEIVVEEPAGEWAPRHMFLAHRD